MNHQHKIPVGERIWEIMLEQGRSKIEPFAREIDMERMTLRRIVFKDRYATGDELQKIASGLGITVDRLKQSDVNEIVAELEELLQSNNDRQRALELAERLVELALGKSERNDALTYLGRVQELGQLSEALVTYEQAHHLIQESSDLYRIRRSYNNLLSVYWRLKEIPALKKRLHEAVPLFANDPEQLGRIKQYRGLVAAYSGMMSEAKQYFLESYEHFLQTNNQVTIGRAQQNLGNIAYQEENYSEAREWFEQAQLSLQHASLIMRALVNKDLARTLIMLGESNTALQMIEHQLDALRDISLPELTGKLLLMKADITRDTTPAETILKLDSISPQLRFNALEFLFLQYTKVGNTEKALTYFHLTVEHLPHKIENYKTAVWF